MITEPGRKLIGATKCLPLRVNCSATFLTSLHIALSKSTISSTGWNISLIQFAGNVIDCSYQNISGGSLDISLAASLSYLFIDEV